jgi:hypothetical protein
LGTRPVKERWAMRAQGAVIEQGSGRHQARTGHISSTRAVGSGCEGVGNEREGTASKHEGTASEREGTASEREGAGGGAGSEWGWARGRR